MNSLSYHFTTILWDAPAMSSPPSLWINSVCFSSISFSICSGVTCIDPFVSRCVRLLQRAVCQLVQTDSFRLARCRCLRRPDGTEEAFLSRDSKCKCAPHKCRGINEYVFMCAAHVDPYICMYDSFTLSWSPGCVHALMDMYKHALSRYVCLCVSVLVCVRWEDPWSSALCFQRIAWLPSLYEPWVQSDRNKKPYSALGIRKTGFGIKEQGHTHADTQTQTQTHRHLSDRGHQAKGIILRIRRMRRIKRIKLRAKHTGYTGNTASYWTKDSWTNSKCESEEEDNTPYEGWVMAAGAEEWQQFWHPPRYWLFFSFFFKFPQCCLQGSWASSCAALSSWHSGRSALTNVEQVTLKVID